MIRTSHFMPGRLNKIEPFIGRPIAVKKAPDSPTHPSPLVSALMSAVMLKTAIYGLLRVTFDLLHTQLWWWGVIALVLGLVPDCDPAMVTSAGNAAGTGARIALLNGGAREEIERVLERATAHLTLGG